MGTANEGVDVQIQQDERMSLLTSESSSLLESSMEIEYSVPLELKLTLDDKRPDWNFLIPVIMKYVVLPLSAYCLCDHILLIVRETMAIDASNTLYAWFRSVGSVAAAVGAFLVVRGTSQDENAPADEATILGRIQQHRAAHLNRMVHKELKEADMRFQRSRIGSTNSTENDEATHCSHPSFDRTADAKNSRARHHHRSTHTESAKPCFRHLQSPFGDGQIKRVPYSHGGFFGAAPFFLSDPKWVKILRTLMPDTYVDISYRVENGTAPELIQWAENNPVVAAFGTIHELRRGGKFVDMEWDVFLDPYLVRQVEVCLNQRDKLISFVSSGGEPSQEHESSVRFVDEVLSTRSARLVNEMLVAHGSLTQLLLEQCGFAKQYNFSSLKRTKRTMGGGMFARQWCAVYAKAFELGLDLREDWKDVDQPTPIMGGAAKKEQSVAESVVTKCETLDVCSVQGRATTSLSALFVSACPASSLKESVRLLQTLTGEKYPIGLVLDVKSRHVPKRVWTIVVDQLRKCGLRVEGIATFTIDEIRDIGRYCRKPVREIMFFHTAGDLQRACHKGQVQKGDAVYFNAGSLLWEHSALSIPVLVEKMLKDFDPTEAMKKYNMLPFAKCGEASSFGPSTVQSYQRKLNLSIGMYVQEFDIDEAALNLLVRYCNSNQNVITEGLSWGGLNGSTVMGIKPGRFTPTDGLWTQRYAGSSWNPELTASMLHEC